MTADHSIAFIFSDFDAAVAARQALVSTHGLDEGAVRVDVREDEAGPTQGNFVIGTKRHDGKQTGDYKEQYADPRIDGSIILFIHCASAAQAVSVGAVLKEMGATSLADRTAT